MGQETNLFSAGDSLGAMGDSAIANYLISINDLDGAKPFTQGGVAPQSLLGRRPAYAHTGFILGYIPPTEAGTATACAIAGITSIQGDETLIGKRIKITLDKFFVSDYPGTGTHQILCEFAGKNQIEGETEELRFALQFKVGDAASASISGAPIFLGVTVGNDGISFEGKCVNVSSSTDDGIVAALDDQAFKNGLSLLTTVQPALKPLSTLASAAVKAIASRSKNKQIHSFKLGLDFSAGSTSARLRHGSYVVVQADPVGWNWDTFEWNRESLAIQPKGSPGIIMKFNYMIFGVSSFVGSKG